MLISYFPLTRISLSRARAQPLLLVLSTTMPDDVMMSSCFAGIDLLLETETLQLAAADSSNSSYGVIGRLHGSGLLRVLNKDSLVLNLSFACLHVTGPCCMEA